MNALPYRSLSRQQLDLLLAAGNDELQEAWSRLTGALHSIMAMRSVTYPRPLYWDDAFNRRRLAEEPARLRGTPFHEVALANIHAAEEIERLVDEHGHTPELNVAVDAYLDALLEEFEAIRLYPEIPAPRERNEEVGLGGDRRAAGW
jgi:hypothetical protein